LNIFEREANRCQQSFKFKVNLSFLLELSAAGEALWTYDDHQVKGKHQKRVGAVN
jgi:hypothetical protein